MIECKRIGLDLDNCLTRLEPTIRVMAKYFEKPIPDLDDIKTYNLSDVFNVTKEQDSTFWNEKEMDLIVNSEFNEAVYNSIFENIVDSEVEVFIITNRDEKYREATEQWLAQNCVPYKQLVMTSGVSKVETLKGLEIDIMVDDKPELFYEASEANIDTKMICIDHSYNRDVQCFMRLGREGELM